MHLPEAWPPRGSRAAGLQERPSHGRTRTPEADHYNGTSWSQVPIAVNVPAASASHAAGDWVIGTVPAQPNSVEVLHWSKAPGGMSRCRRSACPRVISCCPVSSPRPSARLAPLRPSPSLLTRESHPGRPSCCTGTAKPGPGCRPEGRGHRRAFQRRLRWRLGGLIQGERFEHRASAHVPLPRASLDARYRACQARVQPQFGRRLEADPGYPVGSGARDTGGVPLNAAVLKYGP